METIRTYTKRDLIKTIRNLEFGRDTTVHFGSMSFTFERPVFFPDIIQIEKFTTFKTSVANRLNQMPLRSFDLFVN